MVQAELYPTKYIKCYGKLFKRIEIDKLITSSTPMIIFHSAEYSPDGLDTAVKNFPLYYPKCRQVSLINEKDLWVTLRPFIGKM